MKVFLWLQSFYCFRNFCIDMIMDDRKLICNHKSRFFRHVARATGTLLKVIDGWLNLTVFPENITSCPSLEISELKVLFHLYAQWEFFFRSLSSWLAEILGSYLDSRKQCIIRKQPHGRKQVFRKIIYTHKKK